MHTDLDPIRIQGFDDQKLKKIYSKKKKTSKVTEEAFSSQKKTFSTSKHEIY
jgi:hypothetical protein